ncbi:MFS transporter [Silvibacterium acidisoli]|uniref:MFS transporter n=1 Tax=Acidobacteriaceae bacterium ZG23-2 TaxID=2883246 RepID=UPI00406CBAD1
MPDIYSSSASSSSASASETKRGYNQFLLLVAGLGGLLYGVDVGIIGGALPYLQATSNLTAGQLSIIVAAVLLGSVISTLFAGLLADLMGRKPLMILSGLVFVISIPMIALSHGYGALFLGRLLQGMSGGFIGVVVPLYLAECLTASNRGKGTGVFQWLLTFGIVAAAFIGIYYSYRLEDVSRVADAATIFHFKDQAWRHIFWVSLPPGILFVLGSFFVAESPRWLQRRGNRQKALASLLRSRTPERAAIELEEMEQAAASETASVGTKVKESLLRRKYVIPFLLACVILACNTATGINSIIGYNTSILLQSGLSDLQSHWGYVIFTCVNFLMTIGGMSLVDRVGRKFLFVMGTSGIMASLIIVGLLFLGTEKHNVDCRAAIQSMTNPDGTLSVNFTPAEAKSLLASSGYQGTDIDPNRASLVVIYSYGDFTNATNLVRSDDRNAAPVQVKRDSAMPKSKFEAAVNNPFADLDKSREAPLKIERAYIGAVPDMHHGWTVAFFLYTFMASYALGPGVCVWLALSELMPTRIRSNGMSIALVLNQLVSTTLAAVFLPVVSKFGYSFMFFLFAGFTVIYLVTTAFFLPETKGKTLEQIEEYFERGATA